MGKGRPKSRGLADQAGQYGIDGADWKAKAIWHNRDKIDINKAIEEIIKNSVEDDLYGVYHQAKDRLTGRGEYRGNTKAYGEKSANFNRKRQRK